ncbi:hypothetical protein PVT71_27635 (plasmid) [Salipiger sp. H15]|uniref:Oligosaccharide repeat unit polymerase n=1 Tax=Alloyangia sp. H15 TaxID=3029062 RepID=A0AAU8ASP4_9RHOB
MKEVLLASLAVLSVGLVVRAMIDTRRVLEFPFFVGLILCSFVLPQLVSLLDAPFLPGRSYVKTTFMTLLCAICALIGWRLAARPMGLLRGDMSERRLMEIATVFSLVGAFFYYKLSQLPGEMIVGVLISGAPVMYLFFARLMTYGLAIACLCYAHRPSRAMLILIVFDCLFYLERIIVTGKRAETAELAMIFALSFWFQRGWILPRPLLVAGLVLAMIGSTSMGQYRDVTRANSGLVFEEVADIDFLGNLTGTFEEGGYEMQNAMILIDNTDATSLFDYGASHWNTLVWNYLPARFVGWDVKAGLMIPTPAAPRGFEPATGTTMTGMPDAFQSFWYFGALKFMLLAYVLGVIWASARRGDTMGQFVYMLSVVPAMHAFSHQTDWVLSGWIHMLAFCTPAFAYALVTRAPQTSTGA